MPDLLAHPVNVLLPRFAASVCNDRALENARAENGGIVNHLSVLAVVVALDELILDLSLHGLGFFLSHLHDRPGDVFLPQGLTVFSGNGLPGLGIHCRARILCHGRHVWIRRWLDAPVPVVGREKNVGDPRLSSVRFLPGHADEDGRPVRLRVLSRYRVSLLHRRHHLRRRAVDVVLAVVEILVFDPALVNAVGVPVSDPLVPLLGQRMAKHLQALFELFLLRLSVLKLSVVF